MGLAGVGKVTPMPASFFSIVPAILNLRRVCMGMILGRRQAAAQAMPAAVAGISGGLYLAVILQPSGRPTAPDRE
jgi:hypothetical protein